ncbi:AMP-binding protein, partial [Acinetobacter baumannii]
TETASSCAFTTGQRVMAGFIGYPATGCEIKLVPCCDRLEFCVRGKHVMKGYWCLKADQQSTIFDDEGFFHTGYAVRLVVVNDSTKG